MIGIVIGAIAYLIASTGTLGGDVVYALDVMENWYWIVLVFASILAIIVGLVFTGMFGAAGASVAGGVGGFLGVGAGGLLGVLAGALMVMKTVIQLVIVTWLMNNLNQAAVNMDAISTQHLLGLGALLVLAFIPTKGGIKFNNKRKSR